jgi:undecaprenyl-diphosphatase
VTILQAILLGILQGLTEFFPVSSSGHLVLGQLFFNIHEDVMLFDIAVHLGSLAAVIIVFRATILRLIRACYNGLLDIARGRNTIAGLYRYSQDIRTAMAVIIGTIPAVIIGFTMKDGIETLFHSAVAVFASLAFTGCVLLATFRARAGDRRISAVSGLLIGIAQAIAITPGISRSGMTISSGLFLGIRREDAGEFSFLLSIPAILGATVLAVKDYFDVGGTSIPAVTVAAGMIAAFVSGWIALVLLMGVVKRGKMGYFGYYCLAVAFAGFIFYVRGV